MTIPKPQETIIPPPNTKQKPTPDTETDNATVTKPTKNQTAKSPTQTITNKPARTKRKQTKQTTSESIATRNSQQKQTDIQDYYGHLEWYNSPPHAHNSAPEPQCTETFTIISPDHKLLKTTKFSTITTMATPTPHHSNLT